MIIQKAYLCFFQQFSEQKIHAFSGTPRIFWEIYVNTMAADALAPGITETSATMVLTLQEKHVLVLYEKGLQLPVSYQCWGLIELEQLERLCSEISPTATWLPILVIHISSKQDKVKVINFEKLPKIQILKYCKKLYMWHIFWSCLIRCINMKWIQPEL